MAILMPSEHDLHVLPTLPRAFPVQSDFGQSRMYIDVERPACYVQHESTSVKA